MKGSEDDSTLKFEISMPKDSNGAASAFNSAVYVNKKQWEKVKDLELDAPI